MSAFKADLKPDNLFKSKRFSGKKNPAAYEFYLLILINIISLLT